MSGNPYDGPRDDDENFENQGTQSEYSQLTSDVKNWAMLCHLSALFGSFNGLFFLGPLVIWLLKRDSHPFIDEQGKESLNFQISMLIYEVLAALTICIVVGWVLLPFLVAVHVIFVVIASIQVSSGIHYRYPLTIRLIS